ncbi:hypothetical protein DKX38_011634 [Salix brachista]|uniref:Transcriptional coactivator p15 (PC4) C-terminal domain-containing protein n=1 Tax=Salix brachista TaxID=2182728 RepID=A0A5N5LZV5_9ROSI|nr:hypothetical protein DKX38_011634 [Salix brachista]
MSGRGGKRAVAAREEEESAADDNYAQQPPAKKPTRADNSSSDNSDEIVVCEIGRNRRVTVRNWRGKINVDIREFYPKDGNLLPGKKGNIFQMFCLFVDSFEVKDGVNEVEEKKLGFRTESNNFCRIRCEYAILVEMEMIGSVMVAPCFHISRQELTSLESRHHLLSMHKELSLAWTSKHWGITLSLEQWNMLRDHAEEIDKALGHS